MIFIKKLQAAEQEGGHIYKIIRGPPKTITNIINYAQVECQWIEFLESFTKNQLDKMEKLRLITSGTE